MEFNFEVWNYDGDYGDRYRYEIDYKLVKEKLVEYILVETKSKAGKDFEEIGALQCANTMVYELDLIDDLVENYKDWFLEEFQQEAQESYNDSLISEYD